VEIYGLRAVRQRGTARFFRDAAVIGYVACMLWMVVVAQPDLLDPTHVGSDTYNYYAAGLRLDSGHTIYALSPGDLPVPLEPPYATVPLLSPPLAAVIWRPLAALPGPLVMYLWWIGGFVALTVSVLAMVRHGSALRNATTLVLTPWLGLAAWSGNLNCYLVAMLIGAFWLAMRGRNGMAGGLIAAATLLKVTPGIYLFWLLARRDRAGLVGFVATGIVLGLLSLAGAGLQAHLDYLSVIRATGTSGVTDISIPGILINAGLDPSLAQIAIPVIGIWAIAATWQARRHPGASFSAATLGAVFTQPSLGLHSLPLLLPGVAPYAARPQMTRTAPSVVEVGTDGGEPVPSPT
jgi:hypothetical protein